jgi:PAS domain S-box-containing protein
VYRARRKDGAYVWTEDVTQLLRDPEGRPICYLVSGRDITQRRLAELARRESEERFRTLFENSPNGIFLTDPETQEIVDCNGTACAMNGYSREELLGQSINLLHPGDVARATQGSLEGRRSFVQDLARTGTLTVESVHRRKDGSLFPMETSMCLLTLGGRTVVMGIDRDITERKRAQEELRLHRDHLEELVAARTAELAVAKERAEAADKLKSAFLATMSHELRTPLNSILGFTTIMLKDLAGPLNDEQHKQLGMVRTSAEHLLELINDVLDLSKIEAGQLEVEEEAFDLVASIKKVLVTITPLASKKNLTIKTSIGPEVGTITSDRRRVEQVLLNLLSNAIKFTSEGGITVECAAQGDRVVTRVRDTGIGIKPKDLARLFKPFQQLDGGLARRYEGTGLGLSICRRLIGMLGGEVGVESEWGRGSTFSFTLPTTRGRAR